MTIAQSKIKTAIKLLAAKGDILIQAQKGDVELTADKKINITACKEKLTVSAGKEFLLQSGGGYIKISGGNVEIHCPGKLSMKAKNFVHTSGGGGSVDAPTMPSGDYNPIKPGIAGFDNTTFLGGMANGVLNQLAVVTSKITRNDGRIVQPFTGVEVSKPDQQDATFNNLIGMGGAISGLASVEKSAATGIGRIVNITKGERPKPSSYLDKKYIDTHLKKFDEGASFITKKGALDKYGREKIGMPDNSQFVMPKSQMDEVLKKANGEVSIVENELGIPPGAWQNDELVRIDIAKPRDLNLRIPTGNEMGANEHWIPAGKLPAGYDEAVVNQVQKSFYTESPLWK